MSYLGEQLQYHRPVEHISGHGHTGEEAYRSTGSALKKIAAGSMKLGDWHQCVDQDVRIQHHRDKALQSLYPDRPDDPNDTRHRLRARLPEGQAWVAWAQGQPETAASAVQEALRLTTFALGAETTEGRHLAAQGDRITTGERPQL